MALVMLGQAKERGFHAQTLGAVKGYDSRDCVAALRKREATPRMSQNTGGGEALSVEQRLSILGARCANGYAHGWRKSSVG